MVLVAGRESQGSRKTIGKDINANKKLFAIPSMKANRAIALAA